MSGLASPHFWIEYGLECREREINFSEYGGKSCATTVDDLTHQHVLVAYTPGKRRGRFAMVYLTLINNITRQASPPGVFRDGEIDQETS